MQPTTTSLIATCQPTSTRNVAPSQTEVKPNSVVEVHEPLLIDPQLQELCINGKIHPDGKLRLENIALPAESPLQEDAMWHVATFMTTPFPIKGVLTNAIREKIKHSLERRQHEPPVQQFLALPFMQGDQDFVFPEVTIYPCIIFDALLKACNGNFVKLIGGESRRALRKTYIRMMEVITQKTFAFSQKKESDFAKPCPDWDFILPAFNASYEQLQTMAEIIPNIVTIQMFGKTTPELTQLLCFAIRETFFKLPQNFQTNYFTGISFGNPIQKIDITFLPKPEHNSLFEFNKLGLCIERKAISNWMKKPTGIKFHPFAVTLDHSNCGMDKGYQAGFDFAMDILRSPEYLTINERGFARLMYWISKGQLCHHREVVQAFFNKVPTSQATSGQLRLCHLDHNQGNLQALMASFLNTFVSVNFLHPDQSDSFIEKVKTELGDLFKTVQNPENVFEILLTAIQEPQFSTRFFIDWLTICSFLAKKTKRPFYSKTALHLTDEYSVLLPMNGLSPFETIKKRYLGIFSAPMKQLLDRITGITSSPSINLEIFRSEEKDGLKEIATEFLWHTDFSLKVIGIRLCIALLKTNQELYPLVLSTLAGLGIEENSEFVKGALISMQTVTDEPNDFHLALTELVAAYKKTSHRHPLLRAWIYALLKTKNSDFINISIALWYQLTSSEKLREAQNYISAILNLNPDEALSIFNNYVASPQFDELAKIITRLKHSPAPFLSYGLHLEKALNKTLAYNDASRRKATNYLYLHKDFFWLYCRIVEINPAQATIILQKLHTHQCIDIDSEEAAHALINLSKYCNDHEFHQLWNTAVACGCPLLAIQSNEKNDILLQQCESISHKAIIQHLMTQPLESEQTKRLQTVIMNMDKLDQKLSSYLSAEQTNELTMRTIRKHVADKEYYEAVREIALAWNDLSVEQQRELLGIELTISLKLLQDLNTLPIQNRPTKIDHLRPFFDKKIALISKVDFALVSRDQAEVWGLYINSILDHIFGFPNSFKKVQASCLTDTLVAHLVEKQSYQLAADLIVKFNYVQWELEITPKLLDTLAKMTRLCPNIEVIDRILTLLKLYRQTDYEQEQLKIYHDLIRRMLEIQCSRAVVWIERVVANTGPELPLQGKTVLNWSRDLSDQSQAWLFPSMYAKIDSISFADERERLELIAFWIRNSDCPYFCSRLLYDHCADLSHMLSNDMQEIILKSLSSWLVLSNPEVTPHITFLLKLFVKPEPQIWCKALQCISTCKDTQMRSESWLLFQVSQVSRSVYEEEPHLAATACLHGLRGIAMNKSNKLMFQKIFIDIDDFLKNFEYGTPEQKKEALDILFSENLQNVIEFEEKANDSLFILELINIRSYLKNHIPPMGLIDKKIISTLTSIGDRNIMIILLAFLRKELAQDNPTLFEEAIYLVHKHLSATNLVCWGVLCLYLTEFAQKINIFPLLKSALSRDNPGIHLTAALLAHSVMDRLPENNAEKITFSCLVIKMTDFKSNENKVLNDILNHPNVTHWLSEANIIICWERLLYYSLEHFTSFTVPLTTQPLELFRQHFHKIKTHRNLERCLIAGNNLLVRLLIEDLDDKRFQTEMISFYRTIMEYHGTNPIAKFREPQAIPRPSTEQKKTGNKLIRKFSHEGISPIEFIRKPHLPIFLFDSAQAFFEYAHPKWNGKDEIHAPMLLLRGKSVEDIPKIFLEVTRQFAPESKEILVIEDDFVSEDNVSSLEYIFTTPSQRKLFVAGLSELIKSMCFIRTSNLNLRSTVIRFCSHHLLFLITHYPEFKDEIFSCVDSFVFAPVAVDCQHETFRTKRGEEKLDQDIFDLHNNWCHEILTIVQTRLVPVGIKIPMKFYEALLTIYPYEIYPDEFTLSEMTATAFSTISRLCDSHSSLHYERAVEIMSTYQNRFLSQMNGIIPCYEKLITKVMNDPYYLMNEKNLIIYGPQGEERQCVFLVKRPLIALLHETFRANEMIFPKTEDSSKNGLPLHLVTARMISYHFIKTVLDLLESHKNNNSDLDLHYLFFRALYDCGIKQIFASDHARYYEFITRFKPYFLACILASENRTETLQFLNVPLLFLRTFRFQNKAHVEECLKYFNQLIAELLEINDKELRTYVVKLVTESFIEKDFFKDSKTQRTRIKEILAKYS